jgi:hypothetical protein
MAGSGFKPVFNSKSMKKMLKKFEPGTAPYIVAHGVYIMKRGKNPSMQFEDERNPRKALQLATLTIVRNQAQRRLSMMQKEAVAILASSHSLR